MPTKQETRALAEGVRGNQTRCSSPQGVGRYISNFKQQHLEELRELKEYCSRLESRSEDELSTRASYKAWDADIGNQTGLSYRFKTAIDWKSIRSKKHFGI